MLHYFGYGSNMNPTSLRHKGVVPASSERATLHGYQLVFDVHHWFRHEGGVGNMKPGAPDDRVEGVLHVIDEVQLAKLDQVESYGVGYDRIEVEVQTAEGTVSALTYVGLPQYLDPSCLPTRRYLNILVKGAEHAELPEPYLAWLRDHSRRRVQHR